MEEAHRVGERILDEHALGVAGNEILGGRACVIGEQDGGLIVAEAGDEELAVGALARTTFCLKLPRFGGHPNICVPGVHDVEDETTIHT
jgi:hypothetical protein